MAPQACIARRQLSVSVTEGVSTRLTVPDALTVRARAPSAEVSPRASTGFVFKYTESPRGVGARLRGVTGLVPKLRRKPEVVAVGLVCAELPAVVLQVGGRPGQTHGHLSRSSTQP